MIVWCGVDRRSPRLRLLALGLFVAGCLAACGARSTLYFAGHAGGGGHGGSGPVPDGGPPDGAPPDSGTGGTGGGSGGSGGAPCTPDGQTCNTAADCCTNLCNEYNYCGPVPCRPDLWPCAFDSDCCKSHCRNGQVGRLCNDCLFPGNDCSDGGLCCDGECLNGTCEPAPCVPNGEPINPQFKLSCCSQTFHKGYCAPPKCYKDDSYCVSIWDCCSYACTNFRCGKAGQCQLSGQPCPGGNDDCCQYDCNASGTCGAAGCTANGQPCKDASECCSSKCDIASGACAVNLCAADALACKTDSDCCSGHCVAQFCNESPCLPDGDYCSAPGQCCTGMCPPDKGTCGGIGN
jgi:hypothetical protein